MNFEPQLEQPSRCCGLLRKDTGVVFRLLQEDQLSSLDLVTNVIILWNTLYMESVLNQLRPDGYQYPQMVFWVKPAHSRVSVRLTWLNAELSSIKRHAKALNTVFS